MRAALQNSWALLLGIAMLMVGHGLLLTLLGVRATLEGFSTGVIGVVMSAYFLGFVAGSAVALRLLQRVGHVRVFAALASLASVAALVHSVFIDPVTWAMMRLVTGFCSAGLYVVAESWLNDSATNETRGQVLSLYVVVMLTGMATGQVLLNIAPPASYVLFVLSSILVSLALVPVLLTVSRAPSFDAPEPVGLRALYRVSPLGVVGALATGASHGAFYGMGAVFANQIGLSIAGITIFMAAMTVGGVLLQWPIGRVSDRFDRRRVLTMVTFLAAAVALAAAFSAGSPGPLLYALVALFGGLALPMYALCIAHTNDYLEPSQMVAASASLVLVAGVGLTLGPLGASAAMAAIGPVGFFFWLAAVHAIIGAFAVWRMSQRRATPLADQGAYAPAAPSVSPVVATLNPESFEEDVIR